MGRSLPTIRPALLTSPEPIAPSERIDGIDILRGLALFGVLTINVVFEFRVSIFAQFLPPARTDSAIDRALNSFLAAAVELKALALFSFLFGVGLAIQFDRLAGNPRRFVLLLRRLIVLLAIGAVHLYLIWNGDILVEYAVSVRRVHLARGDSFTTFATQMALARTCNGWVDRWGLAHRRRALADRRRRPRLRLCCNRHLRREFLRRAENAGLGRARRADGVHQLPDAIPRSRMDLLWLWARAVRP